MHEITIKKYCPGNGSYLPYAKDTASDEEVTALVLYFRDRPVIEGFYMIQLIHSGTTFTWYTCHNDLIGYLRANHKRPV